MNDTGQRQAEIVRLVRASQAGDKVAFDRLVQMYQAQAMHLAFGILANRDDAADAVQDAFVKAYIEIGRLALPGRFRFWLLRIVANQAVDRQRSARRRAALARFAVTAGIRKRPRRSEEKIFASDLKQAVERAMVQLTEKQARAIALFGLDNLSHRQIADLMGCSVEAVRWHVYRARQRLRVLLQEYLE